MAKSRRPRYWKVEVRCILVDLNRIMHKEDEYDRLSFVGTREEATNLLTELKQIMKDKGTQTDFFKHEKGATFRV